MAACGHGIMSPDIVPVHLVSAFTAESQALESAGGTMAACGHGIMSTDIIPAPIRVRPKGGQIPWRIVCTLRSIACRRHGIMSTDIIPAPIRVCPKGQTNSLANRVHPAEHSMSKTWYNVVRHDTRADSCSAGGRTTSLTNRVHPSEHSMSQTWYIWKKNYRKN